MYRFLKIQKKEYPSMIYPFQFFCDNIHLLIEFTLIYTRSPIRDGMKDFFKKVQQKTGHYSTKWAMDVNALSLITGKSFLDQSCELEQKLFFDRLGCIRNYGSILLKRNGLAYMPFEEEKYIILNEVNNGKIFFPDENYTIDDIKIIQWPGGKHFYAKIDSIDVVDSEGFQKWNTKDEAKKAAKKFLQEKKK